MRSVTFKPQKNLLSLCVVSLLAACGGGGSDNNANTTVPTLPPAANVAPTVVIGDIESAINEGVEISLNASAADSDGSIASIVWQQTGGSAVTLSGEDTDTVTFTPIVTADEALTFAVTVTDNVGATAEALITVSVLANMKTFSITGKVIDGQASNTNSNTNIRVTIGDQQFNAIADNNGDYSAQISVDDSLISQWVTATTTAASPDSPVKLMSLLGTVDSLDTAAGDSNQLTKDKHFGVNITPITTATAALIIQANGGLPISDVAQYHHALKNYDGSQVVPYATAIKLVADNVLVLPEGITNTLELVSDNTLAQTYAHKASLQNEEQYKTAQAAVLADNEMISSGIDHIALADSYYFTDPVSPFGQGRLVLNPDNSGQRMHSDYQSSLTWAANDTGVKLIYPQGGVLFSERLAAVDDKGPVSYAQIYLLSSDIQWINQTPLVDHMQFTRHFRKHFTNDYAPDEMYSESSQLQAVKSQGVMDAGQAFTAGNTYSVVIPDPDQNYQVLDGKGFDGTNNIANVSVTLQQDTASVRHTHIDTANGELSYSESEVNWSIAQNGVLSLSNGMEVTVLANSHTTTPYTNVKTNQLANSNMSLYKDPQAQWTNDNISGIYYITTGAGAITRPTWVELNQDGTALTVFTHDSNEDSVISENEVLLMPGLWQLGDDGKLNIRRYRHNSTLVGDTQYCTPTSFETSYTDECVVYQERSWDLHQQADKQFYVSQLLRFYFDYRALAVDGTLEDHVLSSATQYNRAYTKLDARPIEINRQ